MEKYLAMRIHDGKLEYDAVIKKYPKLQPRIDEILAGYEK